MADVLDDFYHKVEFSIDKMGAWLVNVIDSCLSIVLFFVLTIMDMLKLACLWLALGFIK